jgi:hypothetical protein
MLPKRMMAAHQRIGARNVAGPQRLRLVFCWPQHGDRLFLKVEVGERVAVAIADDEAGLGLVDLPGRREAAGFGHQACVCRSLRFP